MNIRLKLRRIIGKLSQFFDPGHSWCYRCGRTWSVCQEHTTWYEKDEYTEFGTGCFALCQTCWSELSNRQRVPYYRMLLKRWMEGGDKDKNGEPWESVWDKIETAVLQEKTA